METREGLLPAGSLVWAYVRDSGGEDQDIVSQKAAILDYIERHGLVLDRLFVDEARPGSSVIGRDAFEDMIHLSRQEPRPVDGIVLWSFSRFARNLLDAQFFKADLRRKGYKIISMTDDLPGGDFDLIIEALYDWKHERYLKDLSRNTRRGLRELARQGYAPGGFPPRGYKPQKVQIGLKRNGHPRYASRWVPDKAYWDRAKQAFEMWAEGKSLLEIHKATRLFKSRQVYSHMFRNRTYWGVRKCGDLQVHGAHRPIADPGTLSRVDKRNEREARRARRGKRWPQGNEHPRRRASSFLLSGLLECGYCGSAMIGSTSHRSNKRGQPWRHYVCGLKHRTGAKSCEGSRIAAHTVDRQVVQAVLDRVPTPYYMSGLLQEVNSELGKDLEGIDREIRRKERKLASLQKGIQSLLDLPETAGSQAARARLVQREGEKAKLISELRLLQERRKQGRVQISPEVLSAALGEMRQTLSGGNTKAKRIVLRQFIQKIVIGGHKGTLYYTFPLNVRAYVLVPPGQYFLHTLSN